MTANVRCAGGGQWYETWEDAEIGADRNVACGWTARLDGWARDVAAGKAGVDPPVCPECGGRVELIPEVDR